MTTPNVPFYTQPPFSPNLTTLAYPLSENVSATLGRGYMIWDPPYIPGYGQPAMINYLYNPSTVSADYNVADASAQQSLNFPNPGDSSILAIPLSQTAQWTLMFDRTFEVWGSYTADGLPNGSSSSTDPGVIGVQADIRAFMQFTGMLAPYSYGTANGQGGLNLTGLAPSGNLAANSNIMQLVPAWAVFGNSAVSGGLIFYGCINEWSVQYTHWTQFNVPYRAVVSVNWMMLPIPSGHTPATGQGNLLPTPTGGPTGPAAFTTTATGIGGR